MDMERYILYFLFWYIFEEVHRYIMFQNVYPWPVGWFVSFDSENNEIRVKFRNRKKCGFFEFTFCNFWQKIVDYFELSFCNFFWHEGDAIGSLIFIRGVGTRVKFRAPSDFESQLWFRKKTERRRNYFAFHHICHIHGW